MTINELQIQLDLNQDNRAKLLNDFAFKQGNWFLFVDSDDGNCYLFGKDGNQIDISNLELIENNTFWNCTSLVSIQIPNSVTSIGNYAFASCTSLTSIQIPDSVESIENYAFYNCTSLASIQIPDSVKSIRKYAFAHCTSLTAIEIPDSVTSIEYDAFQSCESLASIKIPDSVKSIGDEAFYNCTALTSIIFKGKTIREVKEMDFYPWGIQDESIIKCN